MSKSELRRNKRFSDVLVQSETIFQSLVSCATCALYRSRFASNFVGDCSIGQLLSFFFQAIDLWDQSSIGCRAPCTDIVGISTIFVHMVG